jgi:hypothetical protein
MPTAAEDADSICNAHLGVAANTPGETCHASSNLGSPPGTAASKSSFVTDAFGSGTDNIYTTGGSKDDLDVTQWKFKTAQPSPDKADIENAFIGLYTAQNGDKLAYFGGDRYSQGGDENTAFWLFQSPVSLAGDHSGDPTVCDAGAGCPFSGAHTAAVPGGDNCLTPVGQTVGINISATKAQNVPCTESDNGTTCNANGLNPGSGTLPCDSTDKQGDILIVSAFTTGGVTSTISVYEWVGDHAINAKSGLCVTSSCSVVTKLNANPGCDANVAVTGDVACAITNHPVQYQTCPTGTPRPPCIPGNTIPTPSPWLFTEKSSDNSAVCTVTANAFCDGAYFEAGLNLTALGLQTECTSSFLMNTRSSQSVDSALQDFALGQVGSCTSGTMTTPKASTDGGTSYVDVDETGNALTIPTVASGSPAIRVKDHADIQVLGGAQTFGGSVNFYLCGPSTTQTSNCNDPTPFSNPADDPGVQIGSSLGVTGSGGLAHVDSDFATLTSVGYYCWRAVYSGDASKNVPGSSDPSNGTSRTECFRVKPVKATLSTQASCTDSLGAAANPCVLSDTLSDTATLGGTALEPGTNGIGPGGTINATNAGPATGSITWNAYGPITTTCTPLVYGPQTRSVPATGSTVADGTYPQIPPQSAVSFVPTAVGTYVFVASFTSTSTNTNSSDSTACPETGDTKPETVTVTGTAVLHTAQNWIPNDSAHVTSPSGTTLAGNVVFTLYKDGDCGASAGESGDAVYGPITKNIPNDATGSANDRTVKTSNAGGPGGFVVDSTNDGTAWSWKVSYTDTGGLQSPSDVCETTTPAFTLTDQ